MASSMASERPPITSHRRVTYLACRTDAREHDRATQRRLAARLAALMGCEFDELKGTATGPTVDLGYVVPDVTITSLDTARALVETLRDDGAYDVRPYVEYRGQKSAS